MDLRRVVKNADTQHETVRRPRSARTQTNCPFPRKRLGKAVNLSQQLYESALHVSVAANSRRALQHDANAYFRGKKITFQIDNCAYAHEALAHYGKESWGPKSASVDPDIVPQNSCLRR